MKIFFQKTQGTRPLAKDSFKVIFLKRFSWNDGCIPRKWILFPSNFAKEICVYCRCIQGSRWSVDKKDGFTARPASGKWLKIYGEKFYGKESFFFVISNLLNGHISLTVIEHPLLTVLDDLWTTKLIDTLPLSSVLRIVFFDIF